MLVILYLLFLPSLIFSSVTKITDLSYFPCYYGGRHLPGSCLGFGLDLSNTYCGRTIYDFSTLGTSMTFGWFESYGDFVAHWSQYGNESVILIVLIRFPISFQFVSNKCNTQQKRNRLTKVAGDLLDYNSVVDDLKFLIGCRKETISKREKDLLDCIAHLNHTVQSCYSGVLIENGILNDTLNQKNVSARCGWFIVYLYNDTRDAYDVKVISSHVHHTRERHGCWLQMMNLVACVCVGDNCNNNVTLLMERLMEMPFDLDRAGPMVFHNHNKQTTNQLTAEIAKISSEENSSTHRMKAFYTNTSICQILKITTNMTEILEDTQSAELTCSFEGCDSTTNFRYLAYLTNPGSMPEFCKKPLFTVDIKNYVTDDGWDVYWTEPKPLKKKKRN